MFFTGTSRARAIHGAIIFGGLLAGACSPNLHREDGSLQVVVTQVTTGAESLRLEVSVPEAQAQQTIELATSGPELVHRIQSLPTGVVQVQAYAQSTGRVVAHGVGVSAVRAGEAATVQIQLGPVGTPAAVTSPHFELELGPLKPRSASPLQADADVEIVPWGLFQGLVGSQVATPVVYDVLAPRVDLIRANGQEVEKLQDLWRGTLELKFVNGSQAVTVGRLVLGEDTTGADFTATSESLGTLLAPDVANLTVRVVGSPKLGGDDDHSASVRVSFRLLAHEGS